MKYIFLLLLLLLPLATYSQSTFNSESFIVVRTDIVKNTFETDSTANALVLYENGNSFIDKNTYQLKTQIKKKIKIFNRKGFDNATISVHLYNSDKNEKEEIKNIKATTYNFENGNITTTQLRESDIYKETYNDNYTLVKFTLPNIQEGSVITYSYDLTSPFIFKYRGWHFQDDIPKLYSEYNTSIPGVYIYNIKLVGFLKLSKHDDHIERNCLFANGGSASCSVTTYAMENIPPFVVEDYMSTKDNYLSRIEYELKTINRFDGRVEDFTKSWETVDSELESDKNIGSQLRKSSAVKGLMDDSKIENLNAMQKAEAIYKYVQSNYTWNDEFGIFNDISVKDIIDEKSGNVTEINILLHNLLDKYDIDVKPVLLSTRNNGLPTKIYPVMTDFNYLVVQINIDGKTFLLDATDKFLAFGEIPFRCLNQYGRLLDFKNGSQWIDIEPMNLSTIQYRAELKLEQDQTIHGTINSKTTGYHSLKQRKPYFENKQSYLNNYKEKYPNIDILEHSVQSEVKTNSEFEEVFKVNYTPEVIGQLIYVNPILFEFFSENPFKLQARTYPIDFGYKDAYLYAMKLEVPEHYEVKDLPKNINAALPNGKGNFVLTSKIEEDSVYIYLRINFNEAIYDPSYYAALKSFMGNIVDSQKNSMIVLSKK